MEKSSPPLTVPIKGSTNRKILPWLAHDTIVAKEQDKMIKVGAPMFTHAYWQNCVTNNVREYQMWANATDIVSWTRPSPASLLHCQADFNRKIRRSPTLQFNVPETFLQFLHILSLNREICVREELSGEFQILHRIYLSSQLRIQLNWRR